MNLTFNKIDNNYVAEFTITNDANIHLEKTSAGPIKIYQRTSGNEYDLVNDLKNAHGKVDDIDLVGAVYPKNIRIVSTVEILLGIVTQA